MDIEREISNRRRDIAQRIRSRRIDLELSVDDVATALGKNRATVYRYESSDILKLPVNVLEPLADILETTPAYLMGWTDDPYDYDKDPDSRFSNIPIAIYDGLRETYGDDLKAVWDAWLRIEEDSYEEHCKSQLPSPTSPTQQRMQLLARHLEKIPESTRDRLIDTFESSIDTYFDAMGIPKEDK